MVSNARFFPQKLWKFCLITIFDVIHVIRTTNNFDFTKPSNFGWSKQMEWQQQKSLKIFTNLFSAMPVSNDLRSSFSSHAKSCWDTLSCFHLILNQIYFLNQGIFSADGIRKVLFLLLILSKCEVRKNLLLHTFCCDARFPSWKRLRVVLEARDNLWMNCVCADYK